MPVGQEQTPARLELTTGRLVLSPLRVADANAVFAYRRLPVVSRFQSWEPVDVAELRRFITDQEALTPNTSGTWFQLAIRRHRDGLLLGDCGMRFPLDEDHQAEVGITIAPPHQGAGYAAEALTAVLGYLFEELGKHRVFASVDPRNTPSIRLLERVGLRREAWFRESLWFKGGWADDVIYALLDHEWHAR